MTDLEAISEAPVPRPDRLAKRFARRISPTWGFTLYGILYFAVVNAVGMMPMGLIIATSPPGPAPTWKLYTLVSWYVLAQIGSWWLFSRWMRKRRSGPTALVRYGELVTASVHGGSINVRGIVLYPTIDLGGLAECTVLFLAGARYCFVFAPDGAATACGVGGADPVGSLGTESNVDPLPEARLVE